MRTSRGNKKAILLVHRRGQSRSCLHAVAAVVRLEPQLVDELKELVLLG